MEGEPRLQTSSAKPAPNLEQACCSPEQSKGLVKVPVPVPESPPKASKTKHTSSKYDFVKVRVWLQDHYYVLSRFLVSRVLMVTTVDFQDAVRISLELKKLLVEQDRLDISQNEMETQLFQLMRSSGYGDEYISRFRMMTAFHNQRVPLVILISGTACIGKSTLATQLAERLNLPNILQTDLVYELMADVTDRLPQKAIWYRSMGSEEGFLDQFKKEADIVKEGIRGDLLKALHDGKPYIVEGFHLDLQLYDELLYNELCHDLPKHTMEGVGVIVPFTLNLNPSEHRPLIQNWLGCRAHDTDLLLELGDTLPTQLDTALANFQGVQRHLEAGATRCTKLQPKLVEVDTGCMDGTLNEMHRAVLERIEQEFRYDANNIDATQHRDQQ